MKWLNELLSKWSCHHEWEFEHQNEVYNNENDKFPYKIKKLYICKKCGKFKKIKIN